jgi:Caspase domain
MASRFFEQDQRAGSGGSPAKRIALVVGNGSYPHARLPNAGNDARLVASALEAIGFSAEVLLNVGKAALETAIVRLGERIERAGPGAFGFFYFAGHAIQYNGVNFILPVDADLPEVRYLRSGAVPVNLVIDEIDRAAQAEACVVALDACRDNRIPDQSSGPLRGLASMQKVPSGTIVAFATAADQVADDGASANSPFAASLATRIREPGRRLDEVFFTVARDVAAATGGAQQPSLFVQGAIAPIVLSGEDALVSLPQVPRDAPLVVADRNAPRHALSHAVATMPRTTVLDTASRLVRNLSLDWTRVWMGASIAFVLVTTLAASIYWLFLRGPAPSVGRVVVLNDSRVGIDKVFLSKDGVWDRNRLGRGKLPPGLAVGIPLGDVKGCILSVRVVYGDGRDEVRTGQNLCKSGELVFSRP